MKLLKMNFLYQLWFFMLVGCVATEFYNVNFLNQFNLLTVMLSIINGIIAITYVRLAYKFAE